MKVLSREDILNANDMVIEEVAVPEWGGKVFVKRLSEAERSKWEKSNFVKKRGKEEFSILELRRRLVLITVCDASGTLLLQPTDLDRLAEKSAKPIERICEVARRLAGITKEDEEEMAGPEEAVEG